MELALSNGFTCLAEEELYLVDGGDEGIEYYIGYGIGVVLGIVYDAMVIVRAIYTGSF